MRPTPKRTGYLLSVERAGQAKLRRLAGQLAEGVDLDPTDLNFLVEGLLEVADGSDNVLTEDRECWRKAALKKW